MSQSTRSDSSSQGHGHSHGPAQVPLQDVDAAMQQITTERNSLRSQNDQLWKIIEKQRIIIQNLQKDLAKAAAERDLLRSHLATENSSPRSNNLNSINSIGSDPDSTAKVNGHQQQQHARYPPPEKKTPQDKELPLPDQQRSKALSTLGIDGQGTKVTPISPIPDSSAPEEGEDKGDDQEVVYQREELTTARPLTPDHQSHTQVTAPLDPMESAAKAPASVRGDGHGLALPVSSIDSPSEERRLFPGTPSDSEPASQPSLDASDQALFAAGRFHRLQDSTLASPTLVVENDIPPGTIPVHVEPSL